MNRVRTLTLVVFVFFGMIAKGGELPNCCKTPINKSICKNATDDCLGYCAAPTSTGAPVGGGPFTCGGFKRIPANVPIKNVVFNTTTGFEKCKVQLRNCYLRKTCTFVIIGAASCNGTGTIVTGYKWTCKTENIPLTNTCAKCVGSNQGAIFETTPSWSGNKICGEGNPGGTGGA